MADLTDGSGVYATYSNAGVGVAELGDNYLKFSLNQADVGREAIVSVTKSGSGNITHAVLNAVIAQLTKAQGSGNGSDKDGPDAFTVAAVGTADGSAFVSGTTTVVYLRVQGTGTIDTTTASGATIAVVAYFQPRL